MRSLTVNGTIFDFVMVPAGSFEMGSTRGLPLELPVHHVRICSAFGIGVYPVTRLQWQQVMGDRSFDGEGGDSVAANALSWDDAKAFCQRLSTKAGACIRLPSESEWEYCCRSGTSSEFHFGSLESDADDFGWFELNATEAPQPVGKKEPNRWGIHDMTGNLWEWCEDVWHSDYLNSPSDGSPRLDGAENQPRRCLRGGAYDMDAFRMRSAYRSFDHRDFRGSSFGLRIVMET